jgi:SAM-dependent methyltransferase
VEKLKVRIQSRGDFDAFFRSLFAEIHLRAEYQSYFHQSADRLWSTAHAFGLFSSRFESLLEIGPGFAFLPFLWRQSIATDVAIVDGESFELFELEPTYRKYGIEPVFGDLFKWFGDRETGRSRLPFESARFDGVICWETMEHFNFNPIPFLKELLRVCRKGARICLSVPNQAKLDMRLRLMLGRSVRTPVEDYFLQMDDRNRMKYAPHWREYTLDEFCELLRRVGFDIVRATHLNTFMNLDSMGPGRRVKRAVATAITGLIPSFRALCVVEATPRP